MNADQNPFERLSSVELSADLPAPKSGWMRLIEVLVVCGIIGVLVLLLMPFPRMARPAARRTQCKNNLKQIGLALHNYADVHGCFPPAVVADATGKPLHSWRTLLLPYLDQQKIYGSIDLSKAWDDPVNSEAFEQTPFCYRCPSADFPDNHTSYVAVAGRNGFLDPRRGRRIEEITDGTSNTVAVVEVSQNQSVHWMSPEDSGVDVLLHTVRDTETWHEGGFQGLMADGAVRFFSSDMDSETRHALATVAGGEPLGEF